MRQQTWGASSWLPASPAEQRVELIAGVLGTAFSATKADDPDANSTKS
jgi:hypothetical protein